jgi:hypothetical protein
MGRGANTPFVARSLSLPDRERGAARPFDGAVRIADLRCLLNGSPTLTFIIEVDRAAPFEALGSTEAGVRPSCSSTSRKAEPRPCR